MATVSLFEFLVYEAPPKLTADPRFKIGALSAPNASYSRADITSVTRWPHFTLNTILEQFEPVLRDTQLPAETMPTSVPPLVRSESHVKARVGNYLERPMRHALAAGFAHMASSNTMGDYSPRRWGSDADARTMGRLAPDYSLVDPDTVARRARNHLPGDARSSFSWRHRWKDHALTVLDDCFYDALARVYFYMRQHGTRYGYIITDLEFVAIKRLSGDGELALSEPIPWEARGSPGNSRLTVMLVWWYLGMLASHNTEWAFVATA